MTSPCAPDSVKRRFFKFSVKTTTNNFIFVFNRISLILESFTKLKLSDDAIYNAGVCQNCFIKFNDYDEHLSQAQQIESELLQLYEASLTVDIDMKLEIMEIKKEEDYNEEFDIVEVMLEDDEAEVSESYDIFKKPAKRSKSPRSTEKRSYKRKKNLDEGLVVVEVDGQKIYQCEICKVRSGNCAVNDLVTRLEVLSSDF
jgi:hypothetical protein